MKQRLRAGKNAAFFSWRDRRRTAGRVRQNRPGLEHLESRELLATIAEIAVPAGTGAAPDGITVGTDGSVWFTEFGANKIGTINPATHAISEFPIPTPNAEPLRIALGADGNLWFTEFGAGQIGMINPTTDKITEFALPAPGVQPFGITAGPGNTVWFTEWAGNQIGMVNITSGKVTAYAIPTMNSVPEGITLGSDGNIWFTESLGNKIAMFDTTNHTFSEHALPTAGAQPYGITTGPGGNLWFTEYSGNQVGVYSLNGSSFSEFKVASSNTQPTEIAFGPDGNLWFTQSKTNQVAMFNPSTQAFTEINPPSPGSGPRGITAGTDGTVWLAELNAGKIGTIAVGTHLVVTTAPPLDAKPGEAFGFTVAIEYDSGAVDTGYGGSVTVGLASSPGGGTLAGTTVVMAKGGVVTFTGLSLFEPGSYTLQANALDAAPAAIGPIIVTGPPGSSPVNPRGTTPSPPIVISEHLVMAGKGKNRYVAGIVLSFSSPLDPATAQDPANYTVIQAMKRGRTKAVHAIHLRAVYKASGNTVKLTLAGKPRFAAGGQLVLSAANPSGISSPSGVHLKGNMGGYTGANGLYRILPNGRGMAT